LCVEGGERRGDERKGRLRADALADIGARRVQNQIYAYCDGNLGVWCWLGFAVHNVRYEAPGGREEETNRPGRRNGLVYLL
jgi:hypothetical protein